MRDLDGSIRKQRTGQVTAEGCLKTPEDLGRYRRILAETRPDSILECLPGEALVTVPAGRTVTAMRRPYTGPLVQITTTGGHKLTATPNHPVLAGGRWVPAGAIKEGDNVSSRAGLERMGFGNPHVDDVPAPIGEIYEAAERRSGKRRPFALMDLDGHSFRTQVKVVAAHRTLRRHRVAASRQPFRQQRFASADLGAVRLPGRGDLRSDRFGYRSTPGGGMSGFENASIEGRLAPEARLSRLDLVGHRKPGTLSGSPDGRTTSSVLTLQGDDAFTGQVTPNRVIGIRTFPYSGHVYNLQTTTGWYEAEGIIVHNCGTFSGKSALWFARQANHPRVLTVDISPLVDDETREAATRNGVLFCTGSTVDPACVEVVHNWARNAGRLMVVLDSDHSAAHVLAEMEAYGPLVAPGCYMVVEDGIIRWIEYELAYYGGAGPLDAIEAFMGRHGDEWEIDTHIEDLYPTTQFPSGWMRRR